jgi:hypothetical protein
MKTLKRSAAADLAYSAVLLAIMGVGLSAAGPAAADAGGVDSNTPTIRIPSSGQHGFPFMSSSANLAARHYVEQEFLFSGTAQAYLPDGPWGEDGRWNAQPNPGVTAPYTMRMLVRRPSDPARFNGTVIVEWFNVTAGFDLAFDWQWANDELLSEGYAYVAVSAQHLGAITMQNWEDGAGDRYAAIVHPGDTFAYDIFSQAGRALRRPRNGDPRPLGNLTERVRAVIADGESQSAGFLFTYYNAIHPQARVYDGFLIHSAGFGNPISIDIADFWGNPIPEGVPATDWIDTPYPAGLRTDTRTPVLLLQTESEMIDWFAGAGRSVHLQADAEHLRIWEVAGTAHFDAFVINATDPDINKSLPGGAPLTCEVPPMSTGRTHAYAMSAAMHALHRWVRFGISPKSAPRLDLTIPDDDLLSINRDPATGLAISGMRLPEVAVPIATLVGMRQEAALGDSCFPWFGTHDTWNRDGDSWDGQAGLDDSPTPEPDLQLLYPSHEDYVRKVVKAALGSTQDGFLRPRDALTIIREAVSADVP